MKKFLLISISILLFLTSEGQIITTIAGTGIAGFSGDGDSAKLAKLNRPSAINIDFNGNLFVSDMENHRVRKISANTGIINTIAGNDSAGYGGDGGPASSAILNRPFDLAIDSKGNLYIVEQDNSRIRIVDGKTGIINTLTGNGTRGFGGDSGTAKNAILNFPYGVAVDALNNIFIADALNNRIRKINNTNGIINTIAGNSVVGFGGDGGAAISASLNIPITVDVDKFGNIYFVDANNYRIRKIASNTGIISTVAGNGKVGFGGDGGSAISANIGTPSALGVDALGNIFMVDFNNNRVRKVTASTGIITTVVGNGIRGYSGDGDSATSASLSGPSDIAIDPLGNLYIADYNNNRIRKVTYNSSSIGINEIHASKGINIYPNPASNELNIVANGAEKLSVELLDLTGKEVVKNFEFANSTNMNIQDVSNGIYFVKISDVNGIVLKTEKVIINK